jgi:hypothetical protein
VYAEKASLAAVVRIKQPRQVACQTYQPRKVLALAATNEREGDRWLVSIALPFAVAW